MTSTARTDIHRPSAPEFDPTAYDCLGVFDLETDPLKGGSTPAERRYRMQLVNRLVAEGNRPGEPRYGAHQCGHCGNHLRYTALMLHTAAREFIWVGEDCLEGRFALESAAEFKRLRETAALNRDRVAKSAKIAAVVEDHPLLAWLTYPGAFNGIEVPLDCQGPRGTCVYGGYAETGYDYIAREDCAGGHTRFVLDNEFLSDVADRFRRYGELSDRQIASVEAAIPRWTAKVDDRLARMAEDAAKGPGRWLASVGDKKVTFTGKIIVWLVTEGQYGEGRMLVIEGVGEHEGVTVKVTGTSAWLYDTERGDTVTLTGTIKAHDTYQGKRQTVMLRTHGSKVT